MSRLKERYTGEVAPALQKEFGYANVMAIPKITKVVIFGVAITLAYPNSFCSAGATSPV